MFKVIILLTLICSIAIGCNKQNNNNQEIDFYETNLYKKNLELFSYKRLSNFLSLQKINYDLPDSILLIESFIPIKDDIFLIPLENYTLHSFLNPQYLFLQKGNNFYNLNVIGNDRPGRFNYLSHNLKYIIFSYDIFKKGYSKIKIESDSPVYDKFFENSELWVLFINDLSLMILDKNSGIYHKVIIKNDNIKFEIYPSMKEKSIKIIKNVKNLIKL